MKAQIFTILLIFSSLKVIKSEEKIIFAWQIHRHGARAPYRGVVNYTDVYHENWTEIEELTEVVKECYIYWESKLEKDMLINIIY